MGAAPSAGDVGEQLLRVTRGLRRGWVEDLRRWDVSPHQVRALRVVCEEDDPIRLGVLAERLRIAPRSATEVVDGLEREGYVARRPDPADRRATCVEPTDAGRDLLRQVHRRRHASLAGYLDVLDETERAQLAGLLGKLEP